VAIHPPNLFGYFESANDCGTWEKRVSGSVYLFGRLHRETWR
jgi:hypothetical protein